MFGAIVAGRLVYVLPPYVACCSVMMLIRNI